MKIEGKLIRTGKWWAVEIPLLKIYTQGKSKKDSYAMAKDSIEAIIDDKGFTVTVTEGPADTFKVAPTMIRCSWLWRSSSSEAVCI